MGLEPFRRWRQRLEIGSSPSVERCARHVWRGHTQMSLGLETGISTNYVGGIERGQRSPTVKKIAVLASELDLALDDLFCRAAELLPRSAA